MRRILPAILIAILFHVSLFSLNPGLFTKVPGKIKKPAITITMSYKKKPQPPPVKIPPKKLIKKKDKKIIKKVKKPAPVKVEKQMPEQVKEQKIEIGEEFTESDLVEIEYTEESESVAEDTVSVAVTEAFPLYRANPEPRYPRMARKRGYEGTVTLSVLVSKDGKVTNLWVFESCGYKILDNAALKAVADWIFEPGRQGDEAVEMWVEVPVRFELE